MATQAAGSGALLEPSSVDSRGGQAARIWFLTTGVVSGLGLLGKTSLIAKLTHVPRAAGFAAVLAGLCLCFFWRVALRFSRVLGPLVLGGLLIAFLVIYPKMDLLHQMGRGSDQSECVVLAANRMAHLQWPYVRAAMSSKNAMSCGPGWVALQIPPTVLLGYRWDLVLCWALSTLVLTLRLGWQNTTSILTLTGLCGIVWLSAANGTDFLTFGIVVLAFAVAVGSSEVGQSFLYWAVTSVVLGLIAQFRVVTLVIPGLFVKKMPRTAVLIGWGIATATQIGFLVWNVHEYVDDGPLHIAFKLMRGSVMSGRPTAAALELLAVSAGGFGVTAVLVTKTRIRQPLLLLLWVVFFVPGLEDLVIKFQRYGTIIDALGYWEGGVWLVACIPLAAAGLVLSSQKNAIQL